MMTTQERPQRELTGRHVLFMVVAFFVVIIAVNTYFITAAVTSFRGEDVKGSYRQGLEYNQTIAARELQYSLGWTITANVTKDAGEAYIIVSAVDENGRVLRGLNFDSFLRHPTDLKQDKDIIVERISFYYPNQNKFPPKKDKMYFYSLLP